MTPYVIIEHQKTMIEGRNLACYVPLLVTIMTSQEISVKGSPPGAPLAVNVTSVGDNFLVQWRPPADTFGPIMYYQILYNVLPDTRDVTMTTTGQTFVLIHVSEHPGRLYRITVKAENSEGLGNASPPRYIRVTYNCGRSEYVAPDSSVTVTSSFYPDRLERSSVCLWHFHTNDSYVLHIHIDDLDLGSDDCTKNYIILKVPEVIQITPCAIKQRMFVSGDDVTNLTLHTGRQASGRGFKVTVQSVVPVPGQPSNVKVKAVGSAIWVSWAPPVGYNVDHITAYRVFYTALPSTRIIAVTLSHTSQNYVISTKSHRGQLFVVKVSVLHQFQEGRPSLPQYARAACFSNIVLGSNSYINITTPGYPAHYSPLVVCKWNVTSASGQPFYFRLNYMDIGKSLFCNSDYVSVSLWGNNRRCGEISTPEKYTRVTGILSVTFVSDQRDEAAGFLMEIKSVMDIQRPTTYTTSSRSPGSVTTYPNSPRPPESSTANETSNTTVDLTTESLTSSKTVAHSQAGSRTYSSYSTALVYSTSSSSTSSSSSSSASTTMVFLPESSNGHHSSSFTTTEASFSSPIEDTSSTPADSVIAVSSTRTSVTVTHDVPKATKTIPVSPTLQSHSPLTTTGSNHKEVCTDKYSDTTLHDIRMQFLLRNRGNTSTVSRHQLKERLLIKLSNFLNSTQMFAGLSVVKFGVTRQSPVPVSVTVKYSLKRLIDTMLCNQTFRLVHYINQTSLASLVLEPDVVDKWEMDPAYLSTFRSAAILENQEITDVCDLDPDVCGQNCTCITFTPPLARCSGLTPGERDCEEGDVTPSLRPGYDRHTASPTTIVLAVLGACFVLVSSCAIMVGFRRHNQKHCKIHIAKSLPHPVHIHDIVPHYSPFVGNKGVAISAYSTHASHITRSGSLPSRVSLQRRQTERGIQSDVARLGLFIEDTVTLERRIRMKRTLRRGNSL